MKKTLLILPLALAACSNSEKSEEKFVKYVCDGKVEVFVNAGENSAVMKVNDKTYTLPSAVSASGARYASKDGKFEYWSKADVLTMVTIDGKQMECVEK
jgi:membrane-bound inhibitor of C-type lysozyme